MNCSKICFWTSALVHFTSVTLWFQTLIENWFSLSSSSISTSWLSSELSGSQMASLSLLNPLDPHFRLFESFTTLVTSFSFIHSCDMVSWNHGEYWKCYIRTICRLRFSLSNREAVFVLDPLFEWPNVHPFARFEGFSSHSASSRQDASFQTNQIPKDVFMEVSCEQHSLTQLYNDY